MWSETDKINLNRSVQDIMIFHIHVFRQFKCVFLTQWMVMISAIEEYIQIQIQIQNTNT